MKTNNSITTAVQVVVIILLIILACDSYISRQIIEERETAIQVITNNYVKRANEIDSLKNRLQEEEQSFNLRYDSLLKTKKQTYVTTVNNYKYMSADEHILLLTKNLSK